MVAEKLDDRLRVRKDAEKRVKSLRALYAGAHAPVRREGEAYLAGVRAAEEAQGRLALTVEETAKVLGLSRYAAYEGIKSGEIPSKRVGGRILVPVGPLRAWLEGD